MDLMAGVWLLGRRNTGDGGPESEGENDELQGDSVATVVYTASWELI